LLVNSSLLHKIIIIIKKHQNKECFSGSKNGKMGSHLE